MLLDHQVRGSTGLRSINNRLIGMRPPFVGNIRPTQSGSALGPPSCLRGTGANNASTLTLELQSSIRCHNMNSCWQCPLLAVNILR